MANSLQEEVDILRKQLAIAEERLHDKEKIFNNILESSMAGYWDWYIQDDYEYMSPTFKAMFGYTDEEVPNNPSWWQEHIHPDDLPGVFEIYNKHIESKGEFPYENEVRYYHKDGSIVWVYCNGRVIEWDNNGEPVRMVGSHVNITKLKDTQEELEDQTLELHRKNHELQQFAYITSHDLQEPLRTINNFSTLIKTKFGHLLEEDPKAIQFFGYISDASTRMSEYIKGLLDYSRLGEDITYELLDLNQIVSEVETDLQGSIKESGAKLVIGELPEVWGSTFNIRLLFQNLLSNAIKFRHSDKNPLVNISCTEENKDYWKIEVKDNGIGISEKNLERIFMIFRRLHSKKDYEGTGIGLAHCQKIVELHGGKIWVESVENEGSSFYFTLPKRRGNEEKA